MRLRLVGIAALLLLGGCWTADDVKKTGVVWRGTYAARYDQLASCLSAQTTPYYRADLQFDPNERHATVTYLIPVTGIPVEVYDVRQTSNDATEVSWRTRLVQEGAHGASYSPLDQMRRCGASPVSATSSLAPVPAQGPAWAPDPGASPPATGR